VSASPSSSEPLWRTMCRGLNRNPEVVLAYVYDVRSDDGCVIARSSAAQGLPDPVDYLASFILSRELFMRNDVTAVTKSGVVTARDGRRLSYQYTSYVMHNVLLVPSVNYVVGRLGSTLFLVVLDYGLSELAAQPGAQPGGGPG